MCTGKNMGARINACILAFIFLIAPWSLIPFSISDTTVELEPEEVESQSSAIMFPWTPGTAYIDSTFENLNNDIVTAIVLTDQLNTLHEWQIAHGLLIPQVEANGNQELVETVPSQGILEHRTIMLPGQIIPKLAGVPGVRAVFPDPGAPEPYDSAPILSPTSVRSGELHGATDVWDNGMNGSGVIVAVADSGIDFAHPDLNGTQARYDNSSSPYHGWPLMHDPMSILLWLRDAKAYPQDDKSWWSDTSDTDVDANNDSVLDGTDFEI